MTEEIKQRRVELALGDLVEESLDREASRRRVSSSRLVQRAVLHWLEERHAGRLAARLPRFATSPPHDRTISLAVELEPAEWRELDEVAGQERASLERLLVHATTLLLADLDSGSPVARFARAEDDPAS